MLGEELRVLDRGQGKVGGHVPRQILVALVKELDGDGQRELHHVPFAVILKNVSINIYGHFGRNSKTVPLGA